jgi:hypothetical protein
MSSIQAIDKWHQSRTGHLTFGAVELLLAYGFASWAIDSGSLWQYALAIIFLVGGLRNFIRIFHHNK